MTEAVTVVVTVVVMAAVMADMEAMAVRDTMATTDTDLEEGIVQVGQLSSTRPDALGATTITTIVVIAFIELTFSLRLCLSAEVTVVRLLSLSPG